MRQQIREPVEAWPLRASQWLAEVKALLDERDERVDECSDAGPRFHRGPGGADEALMHECSAMPRRRSIPRHFSCAKTMHDGGPVPSKLFDLMNAILPSDA
jgi:hypothetical protein